MIRLKPNGTIPRNAFIYFLYIYKIIDTDVYIYESLYFFHIYIYTYTYVYICIYNYINMLAVSSVYALAYLSIYVFFA